MNDRQEPLDQLCINTIRTLAIDAIEKAKSGHPGAPMALAPLAYILWTRLLRYSPQNPNWFDRDRFVLSNGHASMLLYAVLYLTGYDLTLDDIKNFRQWQSKTPGHPEHGVTSGVETTTGPLGQGLMNAVGMAMAEAHLASIYNQPGHDIVNHYTYVFCGDGDLMEGASHEAASLAGHLGLGKLICVFDDNHISIEGATELACSDDAGKRFQAYGWHVQDLGDRANDLDAMTAAFNLARQEKSRPSLIILRSHIGYGSPNRQDTSKAHGEPLGEEEVRLTKRKYDWPENEQFRVPDEVLQHMRQALPRGAKLEVEWETRFAAYRVAHPDKAKELQAALAGGLPPDWDETIPRYPAGGTAIATRTASGKVLNAVAGKVPWLLGGSADLSPSTKTLLEKSPPEKPGYFAKGAYGERNIAWGIREHAMCACSSGMALHGGVRPYAATFFIFTDYARPAIRLSALMKLPNIYVMTHDSIGVGEDGPTHQPIEHLASFRAMPNLYTIRPADANETAYAWRAAMKRQDGPTMLVLTRQELPVLDRSRFAGAEGVLRGAYVLAEKATGSPDIILIASGSEVHLILEAQRVLAENRIHARVVSMPSWELFREQSQRYRDEVLPPGIGMRLAVEAGVPLGWHEWVGSAGDVIGITTFGASAPAGRLFKEYGFSVENVLKQARKMLGR
jgi:transketolase